MDFSSELSEVEGMIDLSFEGAQSSFSVDGLNAAVESLDLSGTPTGTPTAPKAGEKAGGVNMADKENILPVFA